MLEFPMSIEALKHNIPHEGAMLWIDELVEVSSNTGTARAYLNKNGHYYDENESLRESSYIEFIAQSFGFIGMAQQMQKGDVKPLKEAFLVEVKNFKLNEVACADKCKFIDIKVELVREIGLFSLICARVYADNGACLVPQADLKVYSSS